MPRVRDRWGHRGQKTWLHILVGVAIFSVALLPFWAGLVPQTHAAQLTSWNPKVNCTPQVYTIEQIIGTKPNKYGGASNNSIFKPGITSSFPPDSTKRWLTLGPTPSGWNPTGPPCTITNVNGTVSAFVQINGVRLNPIIEEDWSTRYDMINGGTAYSNGNQSDTTVNVYTPNSGTCLVVNDTTGGCMHRIHIEIDHDWKAASYCGPSTTCNNSTLHSLTSTDTTPIDVQGFVFWDDGQTSCACHNFSGWELHPLTAWRLSGVSSDFSLGANPNSLTIPPGSSATSKITVSSFNLFTGVVTLSTSVSPPGPGATITPSIVTVPPGGTASSTLNVTTSSSNSGSFDVTVSGTNGTLTRSVVVHVTVLTAFSLSANPGSFPVKVGSSGTSNVTVTSKGGFAGSVHLGITQSGCFNCVTGGISPTDLTLTAGGTASASLSVTATSWGNATLTITGTSGALSSSTTVIVNAQDFSISSSKTSLTLSFGSTDSSTTINLFSQNHFAGTVTLSSSTKPSGITSSLDHSSITLTSGGTGSAILSLTGSNPGDYTVTVNATSGFSSHSVTIAVKVLGDFSINSNKNTLTLNPGATDNSVVVLINSSNGLYGTINIATQVSPSGPTATPQFTSLKLTANGSNATSLAINAGMTSGTYKLNVTATFGSLSHSTIITLTVGKATVTIATSLSASTIVAGGSVSDSSTLTGATTNAVGTVTYQVFAGNACTGSPIFSQIVPVTNGVVPSTRLVQFNTTGSFQWQATYNGDTNNSPSLPSSCGSELLNVKVTTTTVTTTLSSALVVPGGVVSDSATLTGFFGGFSTGGTATYSVFVGTLCTGTPAFTQTVNVNSVNGVIPSSRSVMFNATGTYQWQVVYNGDANNGGSTSLCGSESLSVGKATPSITTALSGNSIIVGNSVTDTATVTGGATPTGTVTFNVYSGSLCSGTILATKTVPLTASSAGPVNVIFNATGTFNWQAVYNGDASNNVASSACGSETLTVGMATPSVVEIVSATTIIVGNSANANATVSGGFGPTGTVTFNVFSGASCSGTPVKTKAFTLASGSAGPFSVIFNSTGTFNWQAAYNGDANNNPITSSCKSLVVSKATPAITTSLSSPSIPVGGQVSDSASLTSSFQAGGTVSYSFFSGNACSGTGTLVGSPVTVTGGVVPNSASQTFSTAGLYSWNAAYSGDANNNPVTSGCAPLTVNKANPAISTVFSQNPITVGSSVTDSATLANSFQAGGTVTYSFFSGSTCGGTATVVGSPVTVSNGIVPTSAPQTFNAAGPYSWNAGYTGDSNNNGITSACAPLTVNPKGGLSITTNLSAPTITVGGSVFDSATITGATSTAGGTVTYNLFASGTCSGSPSVVSTVTVTNAVAPNSQSVTFSNTNPVSWNAAYSGDANNAAPPPSSCEPLTVNKATPTITTSLSPTPIIVGQSTIESASLTSGFQAGGSVNYLQFSTGTCSGSPTTVSTVTVTSNVIPSSSPINPVPAGTYGFEASYSGDANNSPIISSCSSLTVNKASPLVSTTLSANPIIVGSAIYGSATMTGAFQAGGSATYFWFATADCSGPGTTVSTVTVNIGAIPSSSPQQFASAGSFSWNIRYFGDSNNNLATSSCVPLTVSKASPTISTTLSANPIIVGGSVSGFATMTGGFQAGGSATYFLFSTADCTGTKSQVLVVNVSNNVIPSSIPQTFNTVGPYGWNLAYNGDANNNGTTSPCAPLTVNKANPSISTTLSQPTIVVGNSVSASATLTNSFQAGGTVTYNYFSGSACGGTATVVGSPVTVTNGVIQNSASQPFNTAGPYSWNTAYSGDANNNIANSPCVTLTVNPKGVQIGASLSSPTIIVGGSVSDSATITGATSTAGGTVTYNSFQTASCTGAPAVVSTVTVTNGVVPGSASKTYSSVGSFSWNAVYSGDANNAPATSLCEPLTVNKATPTLTTTVSATSAPIGTAFHDSATLTGAYNAGGTVSYSIFTNNACSGSITPVGSPVNVAGGVVPDSSPVNPSPAGPYSFQASYGGDTNNNPALGICEPFTISKVSPTITTTLSANSIPVGGSAYDTATISGGFNPGGTVTYNYFPNLSCAAPGTTVSPTVTITTGVVPNSSPQTFSSAGPYSWNAIYNGDQNNNGVTSDCQALTVNKASPSITTTLSRNPITVGDSVFDTAAIAGGFQAGGFVTYNWFTGGTCSGATTVLPTVTVLNGVVPNSVSQVFNSAAQYSWNAVYSGDTNNNGATSACEPLIVNPTSGVMIFATLSLSTITVGGSVTDSATLTGVTTGAGGTVTYNSFQTASCTGSPGVVSIVTVVNSNVPGSTSKTFNTAGSFSWNAVYSGDSNNSGASSACEPLTVNKTSPSIFTSVSTNQITVGQFITESASLTGGFQAGGSVNYLQFSTGACSGSPVIVSTVTVTNNAVPSSSPISPPATGIYGFEASYSGDSNNSPIASSCASLTVIRASPTITTSLSANVIPVGSPVYDSARIDGGFQPTGTVIYSLYTGNSCSGVQTAASTVTVTINGIPSSPPANPDSLGSWSWKAAYSGDLNNIGISTCAALTVAKTTPTVTTSFNLILPVPTISVGDLIHDSATITGSFQAGGTVAYSYFSGPTCSGTPTMVGIPVTVTNGLVPDSVSQSFALAGPYSWNAVYSGDTNNNLATSACEPLTVVQAVSRLTLLPVAATPVGNTMSFSATLLVATSNVGGTMTYYVYSDGNCQTTLTIVSVVPVTSFGAQPSRSYQFTYAGTFSWNAIYSGDPNNAHATSLCGPLTISKATPTISATISTTPVNQGSAVSASATLNGGFKAGGTATYNLFSSSDCTGNPTVVSTVTVANNVVPASSSQTFSTAGKFGWSVAYNGDSNNSPATSPCKGLVVTTSPVLSVPGAQSVNSGSLIRFTVTATDPSWNNITLTASGLPPGASFPAVQSLTGSTSSTFSWTPSDSQGSADYKVTFTVDDGHGGKTNSQVTIHVTTINRSSPLNNAIPYFVVALVAGTALVLATPLLFRRFRK